MISRRLQFVIAVLVLAIFAMGFYLVHLKRKAESMGAAPTTQAPVAPVSGPAGQLTLYLADDTDGSVRSTIVDSALPADAGERSRVALHTLLARYQAKDSPHPIGPGSDVLDVFLREDNSAVVSFNSALAATHPSGIEQEQLTIFSAVLTLKAQLPQLVRVRFLVDGKSRDTLAGHISLQGWIDVASVAEATGNVSSSDVH